MHRWTLYSCTWNTPLECRTVLTLYMRLLQVHWTRTSSRCISLWWGSWNNHVGDTVLWDVLFMMLQHEFIGGTLPGLAGGAYAWRLCWIGRRGRRGDKEALGSFVLTHTPEIPQALARVCLHDRHVMCGISSKLVMLIMQSVICCLLWATGLCLLEGTL